MLHNVKTQARHQQRGAVLVIALVMLLLLTIIGTTALRTTTLEEKMVGNLHEYNLAFQAAESALREGEKFVADNSLPCEANSDGCFDRDAGDDAPIPLDTSQWDDTALWRASTDASSLGQGAAGYYIERIGDLTEKGGNVGFSNTGGKDDKGAIDGYRIVAWGTGRNSTVKVVLSSYFGKLAN